MKKKNMDLKWNKKFRTGTKTVYYLWKSWTLGCGIGWGLTEVNKKLFKDNKKRQIANLVGYLFVIPFIVMMSHKEARLYELDNEDFDRDLEIHELSENEN